MKTLGRVRYEGGWNGGSYLLDDKPLMKSIEGISIDRLCLEIKGKLYDVAIKEEQGSDHDHGHVYNWSITAIGYIVDVPLLGKEMVTIERLFAETGIRKVLLKLKDTEV